MIAELSQPLMHTKLELYQKVAPLAQLGIWERNLVTGEIFWNPVMREIYEVDEDYLPSDDKSLSYYHDKEGLSQLFCRCRETGEAGSGDFQITTERGNVKWIHIIVQSSFEGDKKGYLYGILQDITVKKETLDSLQHQEERFHQAFDNAPIGMALVSLNGHWLKVNKSLCNIVGYDEADLLKIDFQSITHPDDLDLDLMQMQQLMNGETNSYTMEKRYFHKDGHIIWVLLAVSLVRNDAGTPQYFVSQIKNITERKQQAEILIRERQRLDNIIKSTGVGTWEWHIDTNNMIFNAKAGRIIGYELDELGPDFYQSWQSLRKPEDQEENERQLNICFTRQSKFYACEYRMKHKSGKWMWIESRGKVVEWSAEGQPLLMFGTIADINERKLADQERKRTLEIISAQNSRLLNFAHIVSHNLRSHTGNIQMLLDLMIEEDDDKEKDKIINMLVVNAANLQQTLTHLNEIVKVQENGQQNKKSLNLHNEVVRTLEILSESLRNVDADVAIDINVGITVNYNAAYLESILLNLISNSIKYRQHDRQLKISIAASYISGNLVLEISDNGLGLDMKMYGHKLFGMYKTFHGNSDARGIGLFMVKNQVEAMGGKITANSKPSAGTTFKVEII